MFSAPAAVVGGLDMLETEKFRFGAPDGGPDMDEAGGADVCRGCTTDGIGGRGAGVGAVVMGGLVGVPIVPGVVVCVNCGAMGLCGCDWGC